MNVGNLPSISDIDSNSELKKVVRNIWKTDWDSYVVNHVRNNIAHLELNGVIQNEWNWKR